MFNKIITKTNLKSNNFTKVLLKQKPQQLLSTTQLPIRNYCSNHSHNHIVIANSGSQAPQILNTINRTFKTKVSVKKRCADCYFVRRKGVLKVYCKKFPRHKQRQG